MGARDYYFLYVDSWVVLVCWGSGREIYTEEPCTANLAELATPKL